MYEINKQIREQRRELRLTQQDAAVMIGVTRITYIKWENDPGTMPIGKYEELMAEFARLKALKEN